MKTYVQIIDKTKPGQLGDYGFRFQLPSGLWMGDYHFSTSLDAERHARGCVHSIPEYSDSEMDFDYITQD